MQVSKLLYTVLMPQNYKNSEYMYTVDVAFANTKIGWNF